MHCSSSTTSPQHSPLIEKKKDVKMKIEIKEYVSGGAAAVTNIALTFPLNKTSFRQMVHGTSITHVIRQLYNEGIIRLYRGSLPILGQQAIARGIMFGNYALFTRQIKQTFPNMTVKYLSVQKKLLEN